LSQTLGRKNEIGPGYLGEVVANHNRSSRIVPPTGRKDGRKGTIDFKRYNNRAECRDYQKV